MTLNLVTVVGARPQFIKAAALSRALKDHPEINEIIIHTGQHYDSNMSDIFFSELNIPIPKYTLNIHGGSHGHTTGRMLDEIEKILLRENIDAVLIYGDTNSTLAGALAAAKLHIPVVHVEAGLRSYNKKMPEEINRILTDHLSSYLLCPTQIATDNLQKEGLTQGIYHVGDIMYDAMLHATERVKSDIDLQYKMSFLPEKFALMTVHRAESTDNADTFQKLMDYALTFSYENHIPIIFPVHPRTKNSIKFDRSIENLVLIEPLSYFETQYCLTKASHVLTDSGGLQKEAYFHQVPCITLRSETEWVETVSHGWNRLWNVAAYQPRQYITEYGNGDCANKIIAILKSINK